MWIEFMIMKITPTGNGEMKVAILKEKKHKKTNNNKISTGNNNETTSKSRVSRKIDGKAYIFIGNIQDCKAE